MEAFFTVLLFILGTILLLALILGTAVWCYKFYDNAYEIGAIRLVGGIVWRLLVGVSLISAFLAVPISNGFFNSNNEGHCGQGTRYIEHSYYNAATKTTQTDWQCVAS